VNLGPPSIPPAFHSARPPPQRALPFAAAGFGVDPPAANGFEADPPAHDDLERAAAGATLSQWQRRACPREHWSVPAGDGGRFIEVTDESVAPPAGAEPIDDLIAVFESLRPVVRARQPMVRRDSGLVQHLHVDPHLAREVVATITPERRHTMRWVAVEAWKGKFLDEEATPTASTVRAGVAVAVYLKRCDCLRLAFD